MPIQIAAALIPKNNARFYLLEDTFFRGGMRVVVNAAERDALHPSCKKAGMFVWTQDTGKLWQLQPNLTTYVEYNPSVFVTHVQPESDPEMLWTIVHNKNSDRFVYNVYDDNSGIVIPQEVLAVDKNTIEVRFSLPISGRATFVFDLS